MTSLAAYKIARMHGRVASNNPFSQLRSAWILVVVYFYIIRISQALGVEDSLYQATFEQLLQAGELDLHSEDNTHDQFPNSHGMQPDESTIKDTPPFSAWSYEPICTDHLSSINSKLCVYTSTTFNGGRGISIFTTPQLAENLAFFIDSIKGKPAERQYDVAKGLSEVWYTAQISKKGTGMFASRPLDRGGLLTSTTPILLAYKESLLPNPTREQFLQLAVSQLPPASQEAYLALATLYNDPTMQAQDIASANSFLTDVGGTSHLAVIPEPSRMNHDCGPNAVFRVDAMSLTHTVRVARPIRKDEEITISYTTPLDSFSERQRYLSSSFGFNCTCHRCQRPEPSDAALVEIADLTQSLSQWSDPASTASTKQAERLIQVHEQEGLQGYMDPAYCLAALMYNSVGSERGAKKYVSLCIEAIELRLGPDMEDLSVWREMQADVRKHWSWMRRKRS